MMEKIKTGTTTVGIVCKEGVVLAADRRASMGELVASKKEEKVVVISDNFALAHAGLVSDIQLLEKIAKAQLNLEELRRGKIVSTKKFANLLSGLMYSNIRKFSPIPGITAFLLGGRDKEGFHLYQLGVDGAIMKFDDYSADGSGIIIVLGVMEALYKKDILVKDGIKLAVQAINAAIQRDRGSGQGIDVVTITKDGAKKILTKEIDTRLTL